MVVLHILLTQNSVGPAGQTGPGMLLIAGEELPELPKDVCLLSYTSSQLQFVYRELQNLLCRDKTHFMNLRTLKVPLEPGLLQTLLLLAGTENAAVLRLALSYSLAVNKEECSTLLRPLLEANADLFDFIYRNRLECWSVQHYAEKLGLPLRKFNQLFYDKYGISAKQWFQGERLEHAKYLLETTSKKIIDIALESGFCNAAHFSDCFRRHYQMAPSELRRKSGSISLPYPLFL